MELERTIGITALSNSSIGVNVANKTVAFPCGSVVTEYNPKKNLQVDFYDSDQCISCVTYSPDSSLVAVGQRGSKSSLVVWQCSSKDVLFSGHGHRFGIACAVFSVDGRFIASVGYKNDGKLFLWDVKLQRAVARGAVSAGVSSIAYNVALNAFVTAGADSALHFWYLADIEPQLVAAAAAGASAISRSTRAASSSKGGRKRSGWSSEALTVWRQSGHAPRWGRPGNIRACVA